MRSPALTKTILRSSECTSRLAPLSKAIFYSTQFTPSTESPASTKSPSPSTKSPKTKTRPWPQRLERIEIVKTRNAMQPVGPYSQAIRTREFIICSGQLPADAEGNLVEGPIGEKTKACINALKAILEEAGSGLERIIKVQIFLTDMDDFDEMNREYEKLIRHQPARTCICVKALPRGVNIEIECEALRGKHQNDRAKYF